MESIESKIVSIIGEHLGYKPSEIKYEQRLKADLGADSMEMVALLMIIEETLKIEIQDKDAAGLETVQDVIKHVQSISN